ncbi:UDP-glycosyltransferase UGT5-like [Bactrocera neohumeralis]|uniref:UDP-glycosyltransferase UGT5-like n=1 Tax=Bactrocera neohumeralis TaxID=98809 RepID=UPI002165454B|nr:UDP-glycosyltransferase UGT5-like [Bactrocera neohumeralis]
MQWPIAYVGVFVFVAITYLIPTQDAARILGFFPSPGDSHLIIHCAVADTLAQAGHNVTVIATKPNVNPKAKYNYIYIDTPLLPPSFLKNFVNQPMSFYKRYPMLLKEVSKMHNRTLWHPEIQQFLQDHGAGSFDLLLVGYFANDFHVGLGAHFKCPVILTFMVQPIFYLNELIGNPSEHAYVPTVFSGLKQPMNFWARLENYLIYLFEYYYMGPLMKSTAQKYYSYNFPANSGYPSFEEARRNVALIFANHWFAQGPVRPHVPSLIEVGGIQVKEKPDPLPSDIAELLDGSPEGVIYFSLGSLIRGNTLKADTVHTIFNVLSKLPYKVLWKWGADYPGNASNILFKSWLPQTDVLAHPNIKLFITHGGKGSVVEAEYNGVPMVGIPLFSDQPANMEEVRQAGFGTYVPYADLTEESLREAIEDVINNPKYRKAVREFSEVYRDRPMTPRQSVVWWVDYVLRHKGAKHLQSPAVYLTHWQLMSLDVLGVLLAIVAVVVGLLISLWRFCITKLLARLIKKNGVNGTKRNAKKSAKVE